jgi:hypothetical protein
MADTKISAATAVVTVAATDEYATNQGAASKKTTLAQIAAYLFTRINGNSGAAGQYKTLQKLSANTADQTSTTPAVVMTTTGVGIGTWNFKYSLIMQSAATGTGLKCNVNHTGTVTQFQSELSFSDTAATAATGTAKGLATAVAGAVRSTYPERAINTSTVATVGVTDANADIPVYLEGTIVVSVSGDLQLKLGTEVAASAVRFMAESNLELTKIG